MIKAGSGIINRLCEVLGIDPEKTPVRRIVIDAACDRAVNVYVQQYLDEQPDRPTVPEVLAAEVTNTTGGGIVQLVPVSSMEIDELTGTVKYAVRQEPK